MKAKVTTRVVQDVAGARSNAGGSGGGRKDGPATRTSSRQRGRSASTGSRASPARRETATSGGTGSGGGTGSTRTEEMPVEGADAAGDEEQTEGRRDGGGAATASVASLETMAAALQDLTAVVASIQAGAGHRTVPGGVRRRRQRAAAVHRPHRRATRRCRATRTVRAAAVEGACSTATTRARAVRAMRRTTTQRRWLRARKPVAVDLNE
ncbi:hypothetical protein PF008_g5037 [Phytophthora fragariae]|uniref:Uncharacterized protein n=1 Tax=Phytophthora fragariae TaxID=53985 RepID=A0A6G0SB82_9STRA|nr:hypothetical protein PF008_g5037 [Phytophthora fragariae]